MPHINPPRPIAPAVYDGILDDVAIRYCEWRSSPRNPEGLTLRIAVAIEADDGPAHIFDSIDITYADRLAEVYRSCGESMPFDLSDGIDRLKGRRCRVATRNITPQQGRHAGAVKAVISGWIPTDTRGQAGPRRIGRSMPEMRSTTHPRGIG